MVAIGVIGAIVWWSLQRGGDDARNPAATTSSGAGRGGSARAAGDAEALLPAWFGVRGASPRRIAGRVTFGNAPVAGAVVSLHSMLVTAGVRPPEQRTTGADGSFDFGPHAIARYDVTAEADERVPAIASVDLADRASKPPPDQLELRLQACAASVSGTVFDASGGTIARARVRRTGSMGGAGLAGVTASDRGTYKLCVPRGQNVIEYGADGYGSVVLTLDAEGDQQEDIVLVPEGVIVVRALRAEDGAPIPDAVISVFPQEWGRDRAAGASAATDAEGRARIGRLVPGRYRVFGFADGMQSQAPLVAVAEVGTNPEVILRMAAMARIRGKVVAAGQPIGDASVVAIRTSPVMRSAPSQTGPNGAFELERVGVGEARFSAFPYEVMSPSTFRVEKAQTYDGVVIEVEKLGSIRGRVTRLGKPVEGTRMCCIQTASFQPTQLTDADGRYEFRGVPAGSYELGGGDDAIGAFANSVKLKLARGEDRILDLELDLAGAISGTVVDGEGQPVPGVFVRWTHEKTGDLGRCSSDVRGRYRCGALSGGGRYRAAVFPAGTRMKPYPTADGGPYPSIEVKDGSTVIEDIAIAIDHRRSSISGRVVDGTGAGVADAEVKAMAIRENEPPRFHSWVKLPRTFTGADGSFTLGELAPGAYALQARALDGGEGIAPSIAAGTTGAVVTIERPGAIAGKLAAFPAPPVVYARPLGGAFRLIPGAVEGTSSFRITGLRPGRYVIGAQTTFEGDAQIAEIHAGETVQLAMTAHGRGVVEATVLDFRTRAPIAGAACHVVMLVAGEHALTNWDPGGLTRTDARGRVTIDPAPAGSIGVSCMMPSFRWSMPSADAVLAAGGRASVQLLSAELTSENGGTSGIELDSNTTAPRVQRVAADSTAAKAGLIAGDVIVAVNNVRVESLNGAGVSFLIESYPVGAEVSLALARGKTIAFVLSPHSPAH